MFSTKSLIKFTVTYLHLKGIYQQIVMLHNVITPKGSYISFQKSPDYYQPVRILINILVIPKGSYRSFQKSPDYYQPMRILINILVIPKDYIHITIKVTLSLLSQNGHYPCHPKTDYNNSYHSSITSDMQLQCNTYNACKIKIIDIMWISICLIKWFATS